MMKHIFLITLWVVFFTTVIGNVQVKAQDNTTQNTILGGWVLKSVELREYSFESGALKSSKLIAPADLMTKLIPGLYSAVINKMYISQNDSAYIKMTDYTVAAEPFRLITESTIQIGSDVSEGKGESHYKGEFMISLSGNTIRLTSIYYYADDKQQPLKAELVQQFERNADAENLQHEINLSR